MDIFKSQHFRTNILKQSIPIDTRGREIHLNNTLGPIIPSFEDELLAEALGIQPSDKVLDIGGGSNPFKRADVVTEPFLAKSSHRGGMSVPEGFDFVECFAEELPFQDKEFDFAMSRHVFEHTVSPEKACKEISRVAKRGYLETPHKMYDLLSGPNPSHNWFVSVSNHKLVFERRMFVRHPFRHMGLSKVASSLEVQGSLHWELKNVTNMQFYWEDRFRFEVVDSSEGFDYNNPDHAAEAHLDSAICAILHNDSQFLVDRLYDVNGALSLRPDWALAHNTLGILLWRLSMFQEALEAFKKAASIEKREEFLYNAKLNDADKSPAVADFDYTLPMDEKFFKRYAKTDSFDMFGYLFGKHCE